MTIKKKFSSLLDKSNSSQSKNLSAPASFERSKSAINMFTEKLFSDKSSSESDEDKDPYDYGLTKGMNYIDFEHKHYNDKRIRTLTDGEHFGEIALLTNMRRTCSVRANDHCTISVMNKKSLLELG